MTGRTPEALQTCSDVVAYVHVNDNDGNVDAHIIPGRGTISWDRLATAMWRLADDVPAMLELFESESSLTELIAGGFGDRLKQWLVI